MVRRPDLGLNSALCVGREGLLGQLHGQLQYYRRVTLFGLSGVGTTRLALEYAHRHSADYSDVYRVSAARPAVGAASAPAAASSGPRAGSTIDAG